MAPTPSSTSPASRLPAGAGATRASARCSRAASGRPGASRPPSAPAPGRRRCSCRRRRSATTVPAATNRSTRTAPAGTDFLARICVAWEAAAAPLAGAGDARGVAAERARARTGRRRPRADAAAVPARPRRPVRRRHRLHALDPPRRLGRARAVGARDAGRHRPLQRVGARAGPQRGVRRDPRARAAPAARPARAGLRPARRARGDGRRRPDRSAGGARPRDRARVPLQFPSLEPALRDLLSR